MSSPNAIKNFTRGGQITLHNLRMINQIVHKVVAISIVAFLILNVVWFCVMTNDYEKYVIKQWIFAQILTFIDTNLKINFIQPSGETIRVLCTQFIQSNFIQEITKHIFIMVVKGIVMSFGVYLMVFSGISYWLKRRGRSQTENKHIKGVTLVTSEKLIKILEQDNVASDFKIAGIPIIKNSERAHFFIHGTTGSGKSQLFYDFIEQIRARKQKAIIYDKGCNYVKYFYRPEKDVILNPLDSRCPSWSLWAECSDASDYDNLAEAFIPTPISTSGDPFWNTAARTIFASAAYQMSKEKNKNVKHLLKTLLTSELKDINKFLKGTEAESLVSEKIEKTAISIRAVLATSLKSLKYIKDSGDPFSIKQWMQSNDDACLFVTSTADKHTTLKPLISMWLDIAASSLLSLNEDYNRRIWMLFDEAPTLNKIPSLLNTLAESRKYGGCIVLGLQSYAQMCKIYGMQDAEAIKGLCNTDVFLRIPAGKTADWVSHELGEAEIEEVREGISYGANNIRDGISINRQKITKPVVLSAEISALDNLEAYLKLSGKYPITKVKFNYKDRKELQLGFISKIFDDQEFNDISNIVETNEKLIPVEVKAKMQVIKNIFDDYEI